MGFNPGKELYQLSNREEIEFKVSGLTIIGSLNVPKDLPAGQRAPCLITFPGWKGDRKGVQKFMLGIELMKMGKMGWAYLRLDPPGSGFSDGNPLKVTLGLYSRTIQRAISEISKHPVIDPQRIAVHGVSVGGSAVIMAASSDKRIKALVLWAPRSDYHDTVPNLYWIGSRQTVNYALRRSGLRYNFYQAIAKFSGPVLIIHGWKDTIVNPRQSQRLLSALAENQSIKEAVRNKLIGYRDAGHTFHGHENQLIADSINWLTKESGLT